MKKIILMSLVAMLTMTMTSCMGGGGLGRVLEEILRNEEGAIADTTATQVTEINQVTTMQPFHEVKITGDFRVIYEQGTEYSVRVEATEQAINEMTVYVQDSMLVICKSVDIPVTEFGDVKIHVSTPDIRKIDLNGSGLFVAENAINVDSILIVFVDGQGKVLLTDLNCKETAIFSVMNRGNIGVTNLKADWVVADIVGDYGVSINVGSINMVTLECNKLSASISDYGDINCDDINAVDANVDISRGGNVNLRGTVKNVTKKITGKGNLNITEATPADETK